MNYLMMSLLTIFREIRFALATGCVLLSHIALANDNDLNIEVTANIVENTCEISVENNGQIHLNTVSRFYFDNNTLPTDVLGGNQFSIRVDNCTGGDDAVAEKLHFSFSPQSGQLSPASNQVFANEAKKENGGASGVGIVIFSQQYNSNVLDENGHSDVVYDVKGKTSDEYTLAYPFYARYQKTGEIVAGAVQANILVGVIYD